MTQQPFIRNNFFAGRLLTANDLALEQRYFREKRRLHNRSLHGFGIVSGLDVNQRGDKLIITPGLALDCEGNEILITEPLEQRLPEQLEGVSTIFLSVRYIERETTLAAPDQNPDGPDEQILVEESFALAFERRNSNLGHRHVKGRWRACGQPHEMAIARLRNSSGQWVLDRRLHSPSVK